MTKSLMKCMKRKLSLWEKLLLGSLIAGALLWLPALHLIGQTVSASPSFSAPLLTQELDCPVIRKLPVKLDLSRPFIFEQKIYFENDTHDKVYEWDLTTNQLTEQNAIENILFKYDNYLYVRVKAALEAASGTAMVSESPTSGDEKAAPDEQPGSPDQSQKPEQSPKPDQTPGPDQSSSPAPSLTPTPASVVRGPFAFFDPEKHALVSAFLLTDYPLLAMLKTCRYYQHDQFLGTFWDAYNHYQLLEVKKDAGYFENLGYFSSPSFADIIDFSQDKHHLLLSTNRGILLLNVERKNLLGPYGFMGVGASPRSRGGFLTNLLLYGHLSQDREEIVVFSLSGKRIGEYRMLITDKNTSPGQQKNGKPAADSIVFASNLKSAIAADSRANYYLVDTTAFQNRLDALKLLFPATETTIQQPGTPLLANPQLDAALVAVLELNTPVTIRDCSGTKVALGSYFDYWYQVKTSQGQTGWVYGPYLDQKSIPLDDLLLYKLEPTVENILTSTTGPEVSGDARVLAREQAASVLLDRLRVRETPALTGKKLGLLAREDRVRVLKESLQKTKLGEAEENWYYVISNTGLKGWVYGAYLKFDTQKETN